MFFHLHSIPFPEESLAVSCWVASGLASPGFGLWSGVSFWICVMLWWKRGILSLGLMHSAHLMMWYSNVMSILKLLSDDFIWDGTSLRLQKKASQISWGFFIDHKIFERIFSNQLQWRTFLPNLFSMSDYMTLKRKKPHTPPCPKLNSPSWIFTNWESVLNLETRHFECRKR